MKYVVKNPTNCPNCNAPLKGSVCQYCGTRVGWDEVRPAQVTIPITVSEKAIYEAFTDFAKTAHDLGGVVE